MGKERKKTKLWRTDDAYEILEHLGNFVALLGAVIALFLYLFFNWIDKAMERQYNRMVPEYDLTVPSDDSPTRLRPSKSSPVLEGLALRVDQAVRNEYRNQRERLQAAIVTRETQSRQVLSIKEKKSLDNSVRSAPYTKRMPDPEESEDSRCRTRSGSRMKGIRVSRESSAMMDKVPICRSTSQGQMEDLEGATGTSYDVTQVNAGASTSGLQSDTTFHQDVSTNPPQFTGRIEFGASTSSQSQAQASLPFSYQNFLTSGTFWEGDNSSTIAERGSLATAERQSDQTLNLTGHALKYSSESVKTDNSEQPGRCTDGEERSESQVIAIVNLGRLQGGSVLESGDARPQNVIFLETRNELLCKQTVDNIVKDRIARKKSKESRCEEQHKKTSMAPPEINVDESSGFQLEDTTGGTSSGPFLGGGGAIPRVRNQPFSSHSQTGQSSSKHFPRKKRNSSSSSDDEICSGASGQANMMKDDSSDKLSKNDPYYRFRQGLSPENIQAWNRDAGYYTSSAEERPDTQQNYSFCESERFEPTEMEHLQQSKRSARSDPVRTGRANRRTEKCVEDSESCLDKIKKSLNIIPSLPAESMRNASIQADYTEGNPSCLTDPNKATSSVHSSCSGGALPRLRNKHGPFFSHSQISHRVPSSDNIFPHLNTSLLLSGNEKRTKETHESSVAQNPLCRGTDVLPMYHSSDELSENDSNSSLSHRGQSPEDIEKSVEPCESFIDQPAIQQTGIFSECQRLEPTVREGIQHERRSPRAESIRTRRVNRRTNLLEDTETYSGETLKIMTGLFEGSKGKVIKQGSTSGDNSLNRTLHQASGQMSHLEHLQPSSSSSQEVKEFTQTEPTRDGDNLETVEKSSPGAKESQITSLKNSNISDDIKSKENEKEDD